MPGITTFRPRRALPLALTGILCLTAAFGASTATAAGINVLETAETRQTCTAPHFVSPFTTLGDSRDYVLAPGGSFEDKDLDGWQVRKAQSDGEGSPLETTGDDNERSLKVQPGGSATSPAMCVDLHYPTLRLMAQAKGGKGRLNVEVVYPDSDNPVFHPIANIGADGRSWRASDDMPVFPERGGPAPGMRRVALRFTSVAAGGDSGDWRIDDLYVDPLKR